MPRQLKPRRKRPPKRADMGARHRTLSLHDQLDKEAREFLAREQMSCPKTQDGLVMLINALRRYTEEGKALFPELFVFDSLREILRVLPESEAVEIGEGPKNAATMEKALKKCAPLARRGWAVYIERRLRKFGYGVFRCGSTVLSLSPTELLINRGDPGIPAMMMRQIAENVIQVKGVSQSSLVVHFGATTETQVSPVPILNQLTDCLTSDVPTEIQEQVGSFYRTIFSGVFRAGHGTLAAVISSTKRSIPKAFRDGIPLSPPISVTSKVQDLLGKTDCGSNTQLQACAALITGMLLSDGITLFGSDGAVRAYNVFIKHPRETTGATGGARMRTFNVLASRVRRDLVGAFIQS